MLKFMEDYSPEYRLYLLREELDLSEYNIYDHKRTKRIASAIIQKYFDDYTMGLYEKYGGAVKALQLWIYDYSKTNGIIVDDIACY